MPDSPIITSLLDTIEALQQENEQLRAQVQALAKAKAEGRLVELPCKMDADKKSVDTEFTVNDLMRKLSGGTYVVIGRSSDDGDRYWPTVEDNEWWWKGTATEWFKEEQYTLAKRQVEFISEISSTAGFALRVLVGKVTA